MNPLHELAYAAGKKRQSSRTNLVHSPDQETISLYDNFCYAYALLAQKKAETALEAKTLLSRLFAFQSPEGNFPIHLHDYPKTFDLYAGLRIAPILLRTLSHYGAVIGPEWVRVWIESPLQKILTFYQDKSLPPMWQFRYAICRGVTPTPPAPQDIWEHWISLQFLQTPICDFYHKGLSLAIPTTAQEGFEPAPTLIEWACAASSGHLPPRLAKAHPNQLHLAALDHLEVIGNHPESLLLMKPFSLYWQDDTLHSLTFEAANFTLQNNTLTIPLPETFEFSRDDLFETAFYCDAKVEFAIEGKAGTSFQLGQPIQLKTPRFTCTLQFELLQGSGDFCGRIFRSNRPNQIAAPNFEAFDWKIGLRTLRRSPDCIIQVTYKMTEK
jgi:hypothetical protein